MPRTSLGGRMILEGDACRHGQLDLGPRRNSAPHFEPRPDLLRTLAHPRKSPVPVAARLQHLGVYPDAVVADEQAQAARVVLDFHLDLLRARMAESVHQRLVTDAIDLVADGGV